LPSPSAKTVVLTGASSGIGAALTKALAEDGHRLYVCARRGERLAEVTEGGRRARYRTVDVADEPQVIEFARFVAAETEKIDALICCAGGYGPIGPFQELDSGAWLDAIRANLFGTFLTAKHFVPLLEGCAGARIITFSGGGAFNPLPRYSAYAASKAAIVRLSETMAEELKPLGIAVNGVAPGFVKTEIHDRTLAAGPDAAGQDFYATTKAKLESGSVPIEVPVACVRYLLSEAANGLTGKTISASFDPWETPAFEQHIEEITASDLYTLRRINLTNLPDEGFIAALKHAPKRSV
jgi:NAD(P)-dependent dehydrogenase (short-subunit alcohol dehydrogenase family)